MALVQEQPKLDIKLTNINLIFQWKFKLDNCDDRNCKICRSTLDTIPPQMFEKNAQGNIVVDHKICIGKCKHIFHKSCIDAHIKDINLCPVCNTNWETEKIMTDSSDKIGIIKKNTQ